MPSRVGTPLAYLARYFSQAPVRSASQQPLHHHPNPPNAPPANSKPSTRSPTTPIQHIVEPSPRRLILLLQILNRSLFKVFEVRICCFKGPLTPLCFVHAAHRGLEPSMGNDWKWRIIREAISTAGSSCFRLGRQPVCPRLLLRSSD
jgi:hypothetical protein